MARGDTNDAAVNSFRSWLEILNKYPISWFFAGLFVVMLADGSVKLVLGGAAFAIMPSNAFVIKMLFRVLGFSIAIASAFLILGVKFKSPRTLYAMGVVVWTITVAALTWHYFTFSNHYRGAKSWDYDPVAQEFTVELIESDLSLYRGKNLVFVLREDKRTVDASTDTAIVISRPFVINGGNGTRSFVLNTKELTTTPQIGSVIECYPIIVEPGTDVGSKRTLAELEESGAHRFLTDPVNTIVGIKKVTPTSLNLAYQQMSDPDKKFFLNAMNSPGVN